MNRKDIAEIFEILKNKYKVESLIELQYKNPYTLLVAVILSAQATDAGVNKATKDLFKTVDTPEKMLELVSDLRRDIKTRN